MRRPRGANEWNRPSEEGYRVSAGDIFMASWGYDQTNVDFYLVESVTASGKSCYLRPIGARLVEAHGPAGERVEPDPETRLGKPSMHRLGSSWEGEPSIKVRGWGVWAHPWHGGSAYQTDPTFGH